MSLRNPIARARGLGSAKEGTGHFLAQRLTALALAPLLVWFIASVVGLVGATHAEIVAWLSQPVSSVLFVVMLVVLFWHSMLGMQVIVEDYIHNTGLKFAVLVGLKFGHVLLAVAAVWAVLRIAFGGVG